MIAPARGIAAGRPVLTLAELESFDRHAPAGGDERRFLCPLEACTGKSPTAAHRSLALNTASGLWQCHRCGAGGQLREHWPALPPRGAHPIRMGRRPRPAPPRVVIPPDPQPGQAATAARVPELLAGLAPLAGTPGEAYLRRRGLGAALDGPAGGLAGRAGVGYTRRFHGQRPGVVYPMHDLDGRTVALSCRHFDGQHPEKPIAGDGKLGAFFLPAVATARAASPEAPLVLVEGPADALALAAAIRAALAVFLSTVAEGGAGQEDVAPPPSWTVLALVGTQAPYWLPRLAAFRPVYVATDADAAGDQAAEGLRAQLARYGATCTRLRPPALPPRVGGPPGKDWAAALEALAGDALALAAVDELAPLVTNLQALADAAEAAGALAGAPVEDTLAPPRAAVETPAPALPTSTSTAAATPVTQPPEIATPPAPPWRGCAHPAHAGHVWERPASMGGGWVCAVCHPRPGRSRGVV